jgi:hypothetical protein
MEKSWPIAVFAIILIAIVCVSGYTDQGNHEKQGCAGNCAPVSAISAGEPHQTSQNGNTPKSTPFWRKVVAWPDGVACMAVLATLFFIGWQAFLTRRAIASSDAASKIELRAYVVVNVVSGTIQDRSKNLKFEGSPLITNSGKTPAHNVRWRTNSIALRDSESGTYSFPSGEKEFGGEVLGVGQTMRLGVVYPDFYDAEDVEDIKLGENGRAFYYWGVISYDDAFGKPRVTHFCHRIHFYPDPDKAGNWKVGGQYVAGRNKAT